MTDNADLIAEGRAVADLLEGMLNRARIRRLADALEATDARLQEAEAVIAEALEPKNIDYGHIDIALERVRAALSRYKPTNQEEP